jgi:hypothetical protein
MTNKTLNFKYAAGILLVLSISIGLILGEVILRFWMDDNIESESSESQITFGKDINQSNHNSENPFDHRSKFEVYCDLKKKGISSFPNIHPRDLLAKNRRIQIGEEFIFPLSGIAKENTIFCNEWGKYIFFESDELGFRNPLNIWDSEKIQVALIGDSFTHGNCVPEVDTIAGNIRKKYPLTLTLGRSGNGPLTEYATLKEFLPSQKPQFVFWIYYEGNDLTELETERKESFLKNYIDSSFSFGLKNHQSEVNDQLKDFIGKEIEKRSSIGITCENVDLAQKVEVLLRPCSEKILGCNDDVVSLKGWKYLFQKGWNRVQPHFLRLFPTSHPDYRPFHHRDFKPLYELLITLLGQAKNTVESWGGKLIFVYLPDVRENKKLGMFEKEIKERVLKMGMPFVDGNLVFQSNPPKSIRKLDPDGNPLGHYNAKGYSLIAQAMLKEINMETAAK